MPRTSTKTKSVKTTAAKTAAAKTASKPAIKKPVPPVKEHKETDKAPKGEFSRAIGRRKCASARVKLFRGNGAIMINGQDYKKYFSHFALQEAVLSPLKAVGKDKDLDISAKVSGGGKKGQADAVKHGIARALIVWNAEFKKSLKAVGVLTRDARVKERKKFGLKRARRAPQWSKR